MGVEGSDCRGKLPGPEGSGEPVRPLACLRLAGVHQRAALAIAGGPPCGNMACILYRGTVGARPRPRQSSASMLRHGYWKWQMANGISFLGKPLGVKAEGERRGRLDGKG